VPPCPLDWVKSFALVVPPHLFLKRRTYQRRLSVFRNRGDARPFPRSRQYLSRYPCRVVEEAGLHSLRGPAGEHKCLFFLGAKEKSLPPCFPFPGEHLDHRHRPPPHNYTHLFAICDASTCYGPPLLSEIITRRLLAFPFFSVAAGGANGPCPGPWRIGVRSGCSGFWFSLSKMS